MLEKIKSLLTNRKTLIIIAVLSVVIIGLLVFTYIKGKNGTVAILDTNTAKSAQSVANALQIDNKTAEKLIPKMQNAKPELSFHIPSPPKEAAVKVEKDIKKGVSPANTIPADKTLIVPTETTVEVNRITLDKPRAVGVYVSSESIGAMAQYKNVVVFGGPKYDGGYEVGTAYMVRW